MTEKTEKDTVDRRLGTPNGYEGPSIISCARDRADEPLTFQFYPATDNCPGEAVLWHRDTMEVLIYAQPISYSRFLEIGTALTAVTGFVPIDNDAFLYARPRSNS